MLQQRDPVIYLSYRIYPEDYVSSHEGTKGFNYGIRGKPPSLVLPETDANSIMRVADLPELRHQMHLYKSDPVS